MACDQTALAAMLFVSAMFGAAVGAAAVWLHRRLNRPRPPAGNLAELVRIEILHAASSCSDRLTARHLRVIADALERRAA